MRKLLTVDRTLVLNVLSKGLGYSVENNPIVGEVARLSPREAFTYAVLTSHGYLDAKEPDNLYRLTRDSFRVFNQAEQFELQEGLFSLADLRLAATVNNEAKKKPYIASGDKFVVPIVYSTYDRFQQYLRKIIQKMRQKGYNPNDFIIAPIRRSNSGIVEFESFFEFIASTYFNRKEYLTDTQIPFYYGIGTPDVAAYRIPEILTALKNNKFLGPGGSPIELMAVSVFGFSDSWYSTYWTDEAVVLEVKTSQMGAPQIRKYTETKIFDKAYEVIPCVKRTESYAGLITVDPSGRILIYECQSPLNFSPERRRIYLSWVMTYLKMYLLANLTTSELESFLASSRTELNRTSLLQFIRTIKFEDLLSEVKRTIIGRR